MSKLPELIKPKKPIEPNLKDYISSAVSMVGMTKEEVEAIPYIKDSKQYQKDKAKYDIDIELYEQRKLIRFIKNADEKLILKKYKIFEISKITPAKDLKPNRVIFGEK
jgi:predicted DNA-binding protein (UPF0251 family)